MIRIAMWFVLSIAAAVAVVAAYGGFVLLTASGEPAIWKGEITLEGPSALSMIVVFAFAVQRGLIF